MFNTFTINILHVEDKRVTWGKKLPAVGFERGFNSVPVVKLSFPTYGFEVRTLFKSLTFYSNQYVYALYSNNVYRLVLKESKC